MLLDKLEKKGLITPPTVRSQQCLLLDHHGFPRLWRSGYVG